MEYPKEFLVDVMVRTGHVFDIVHEEVPPALFFECNYHEHKSIEEHMVCEGSRVPGYGRMSLSRQHSHCGILL